MQNLMNPESQGFHVGHDHIGATSTHVQCPKLGHFQQNIVYDPRTHQYFQSIPQNNNLLRQCSYTDHKAHFAGFYSSSRAKPQTKMTVPLAYVEVGPELAQNTSHVAGPVTMHSSSRSLNSDTYSGFFSGTSFSQSDCDESFLLSCKEIKLLKKQKVGYASGECSICFEKYSKGQVIRNLPCGHKFHYKCMKPWLRTQSFCPLCRFDLKAFCSQKVEAQTSLEFLGEQAHSGDCRNENVLLEETSKKATDSHSRTFIEGEPTDEQQKWLEEDVNVSAIKMENCVDHLLPQEILKNEDLLRLRVMGCDTESNVSFFGKKQEPKPIYFGIEDDISEIEL